MTTSQLSNDYLAESYNDLPYKSHVFSHCQPTRLHALAKMKGLSPAPLENAKVLEIGCSYGGNLLPYAIRYPNSQLVGIDLSEHQIQVGQQILQQVGVENIELVAADISKVSFNLKFDYIICHGVFSWVPEFVREAILKTIQDYLAPNGIAFISYNTYPGWKNYDVAKELMLFGSNETLPRRARVEQSLETLDFTKKLLERRDHSHTKTMNAVFDSIVNKDKYYIAHEYFEDYNNPMYFREFIRDIHRYDLAYVADSSKPAIIREFLFDNEEYQKICNFFNHRQESVEQYIDFIENCQFRTSIITHHQNLIDNNIQNNVKQHALCHHFYDLYFAISGVEYVERNGDVEEHWNIIDNGVKFKDTPVNNAIFNYLKTQKAPCKMSTLFEHIQTLPEYNQGDAIGTIWLLIHLPHVYLCFSPEDHKDYAKKPLVSAKNRQLIQYVLNNTDVITLSNQYYKPIKMDFFTEYLSQYLDGTKTLKGLAKQIREDFDNQRIIPNRNGEPISSDEMSNKEIDAMIKNALENLANNGFFKQYS